MYISVQSGGIVPEWNDMEAGYRMIREAGFDGIDWNLDHAWDRVQVKKGQMGYCIFQEPLEKVHEYYAQELAIIRKNGLKLLQAHAPFPAYVKGADGFVDWAIAIYKQCIRFCGSIGLKYLVIHGISLALDDETQSPATVRELNLHLYESLIPVLQETDVVVCLENLFTNYQGNMIEGVCSDPDEAVWYIDHLNGLAGKECFGICVDTGHLNLLGKNIGVYIRKLGSRVKALHLHDNEGTKDSHLAPYTGNIRWKDVTEALAEIGYTGSLNFETFRHVTPSRVDAEAVPAILRMIYEIGAAFRDRIEHP